MKYIIEIIEVETLPNDWTKMSSWPGPGIYKVKSESCVYHIAADGYSVDYIGMPALFTKTEFVDHGHPITEALLLKAIAAASRAEVLK
jgi:hypothetical protein